MTAGRTGLRPRGAHAGALCPWRRAGLAAALLALTAALAACGPQGPAENRPPGVARGAAEDGLTVGHRLMAAGEHELALKAYTRAAAERGITVDVLSAMGSANLQLGRLGQAERLLRRALEAEPDFVPALNNLGVVLMEQGKTGEARRVFEQAFALDSGRSDSIRENLRLAIARTESNVYASPEGPAPFALVRRDKGQFVLLSQL